MLERDKVGEFGVLVNNHQNRVEGPRTRKTLHEVQRDHLPSRVRNRQRLEQTWVASLIGHGLLANRTRLDKVLHGRLHGWLVEILLESAISHRDAVMLADSRRMHGRYQLGLKNRVITNPNTVTKTENTTRLYSLEQHQG